MFLQPTYVNSQNKNIYHFFFLTNLKGIEITEDYFKYNANIR